MSEGLPVTEGQGAPATQPSTPNPASVSAPEGFVEKARLDGALQKIQELTLLTRSLTEKAAAAEQKYGSLEADLAQKESVWSTQQGEFTRKLESATQSQTQLQADLAKYQAMQLKMKIVNDLKVPQLFGVLDLIPDSTDEAVLTESVKKFAGFANQIAQTREKELIAGVTTIPQSPTSTAQLPSTNEGWQAHVNSLSFGSPEYHKAMESWHSWLFSNNK